MNPKEASDLATEVYTCASGWEPDARLIGNVKAEDVARLALYADESARKIAKLEHLLELAMDLAYDGMGYTSEYFLEKWRFKERAEAIVKHGGLDPETLATKLDLSIVE